jgi:hypothetical protein
VAAAPTQPSPGAPGDTARPSRLDTGVHRQGTRRRALGARPEEQGSHISQTSTMVTRARQGLVPIRAIRSPTGSRKRSSSDTPSAVPGDGGQNIYQPVYSSLPLPRLCRIGVQRDPDLVIPPNV